jgi:alcohol dehydrogenase class IV
MEKFKIPRNIYFGEDSLDALRKLKGKSALVIIGGKSMKENGILDKVIKNLRFTGMVVNVINGIPSNPEKELLANGAFHFNKYRPDWIVALGGGSVIDAAKAMWIFYEHPNLTFDELLTSPEFPKLRSKSRFVAIPSTSGTGSEVSPVSVITDMDTRFKWAINNSQLVPDMVILDPSIVESLPEEMIAYTGMDALTHAIESYVGLSNQPFSNALALDAIKNIFTYLPLSYDGDLNAREKVHYAASQAGMAFSNANLGIVHTLSDITGVLFTTGFIPHGLANAIYLPYCIKFNALTAPERYVEIGHFIGLNGDDEEVINDLCAKIFELNQKFKIPHDLKEYGVNFDEITDNDAELMDKALQDECTNNNPRKIEGEMVMGLLHHIYEGIEDFY